MGKHFLRTMSIILAVTFLVALVPAANLMPSVYADDLITRAEWVRKLVVLFDMTVEQDNMPDDYFTDLDEDSEYYRDIMIAAEFGVVDIEAGYPFCPEDPVTREFAAQTMNYCLGFEPDENAVYPFGDIGNIKYPADALISIERGWFTLDSGDFLPDEIVTTAEMEAIFADAASVRTATEIDEEHNNTYQFTSDVIEIPAGTDVSADENNVVTIYNNPKTISDGQTFVVYISDIPQAYIAKSVSVNDSITTITTDAMDTDSVIVDADAQGFIEGDLSLAEPIGDDVTISYVDEDISPAGGISAFGTVKPKAINIKKDITLGNGKKFKAEVELSKLVVEYKTDIKNQYAYAAVTGVSTVKGSASFDFWAAGGHPSTLELVRIPVAGVGAITVAMEYSLTGTVTLTYSGNFHAGIEYSSRDGFRVTRSFTKKSFTISTEIQFTAGIQASLGFDLAVMKGSIYAKAGAKIRLATKTYNDGKKPNTCIHQAGFLYASVGAYATAGIGAWKKSFSKSFDIYTESNSPVRVVHHVEDSKLVQVCTRDKNDSAFYGKGYYTYLNSRYKSIPNGFPIEGSWGSGATSNPYIITNEDELAAIASNSYENNFNAHYMLYNDIALTADTWTPIGHDEPFNGVFDGDGHKITNLKIQVNGYDHNGLFGIIESNGVVKNLGVDAAISVTAEFVGGIAGLNRGTIKQCYTTGTVIGEGDNYSRVGGLVGENYGSGEHTGRINDCYSRANVGGNINADVGGLVGKIYNNWSNPDAAIVKRSYATGQVTSTSDSRGGLVGSNGSGAVQFSYYDKSTTKQGDFEKGFSIPTAEMKTSTTFAGWDFSNVWAIDNETNNGYPHLKMNGENKNPTLIGEGTEPNPYIIKNERELLGIAGGEYPNAKSANYQLANDIVVTAKYWQPILDFDGSFDGKGFKINTIRIPQSANQYNGLFGSVGTNGVVKNLGVDVAISVTATHAGGIIGQNMGTIQYCYTTGAVMSDGVYALVGGLVGESYGTEDHTGRIYDCYSRATVAGNYEVGGLVGRMFNNWNNPDSAIVKRSYATGQVTSISNSGGGLVGRNVSGAVQFSYYDKSTSKQGDYEKGFSIPTAEMKTSTTFAGWDFSNVWAINSETNNGYPYLKMNGENKNPTITGTGTTLNPYIITNERELMGIAGSEYTNAKTANYRLANDIVVTAKYWQPILDFNGSFDGKGFKINTIRIPQSANQYNGLFGSVGTNGVVKNLGVDVAISVTATHAGGITGQNMGTIQYCYTTGYVMSDRERSFVGGLVGESCGNDNHTGRIYDCYSRATVVGDAEVGGLVGILFNNWNIPDVAIVKRSYATGQVTSISNSGGGLVGRNVSGAVEFSYYDANTTKQGDFEKGFSIPTAEMKTATTFAGWDFTNVWAINSETNNGYPYLKMNGENESPTIAGAGTALNPYIITNERELMGITGLEYANAKTANYRLANDIVVTAKYWQPILDFNGSFDGNGFKINTIRIPQSANQYNGLFGNIGTNGVVKNLGVDVAISVTATHAGGIIGQNYGTIQYCYTTGYVMSDGVYALVGGLVGESYGTEDHTGRIYDCYSRATVRGYADVGGLVGRLFNNWNNPDSAIVKRSYATGQVTNIWDSAGGLVGRNVSGAVQLSYYDADTTGQSDTDKGFATTTADMKKAGTFTEWDFTDVWGINSNINSGYPYLIQVEPKLDRIASITITNNTIKKDGSSIKGDLSAKVTNHDTKPQPVSVILAIYDDTNSKLVYMEPIDLTLAVNDNTVNFNGVNVTNVPNGNYKWKLIIWDSADNMEPLSDPKEDPVQ